MNPATAIWRNWKKPKRKRGWWRTGCANWSRKTTKSGTKRTVPNARSNGATWRCLLRAPANKAEAYAKEFERAGVPLVVERGGFYDSTEIADLLSLLKLLDNPLQDVPAIAVLRSPLVGLSLDELATIRLAAKDVHFWTALNRAQKSKAQSPK